MQVLSKKQQFDIMISRMNRKQRREFYKKNKKQLPFPSWEVFAEYYQFINK